MPRYQAIINLRGYCKTCFYQRLSPWAHNKWAFFPTRCVPTATAVGNIGYDSWQVLQQPLFLIPAWQRGVPKNCIAIFNDDVAVVGTSRFLVHHALAAESNPTKHVEHDVIIRRRIELFLGVLVCVRRAIAPQDIDVASMLVGATHVVSGIKST